MNTFNDEDKYINFINGTYSNESLNDIILGNGSEINTRPWSENDKVKQSFDFTKYLSPALEVARTALSLGYNNKINKTLEKGLKPALSNPYEKYSPVTGAYSLMLLKNKQAADILSRARNTQSSDMSLNIRTMLAANKQASELQQQGFVLDDNRIKETTEKALVRSEENKALRTQIANANNKAIIDNNNEIAENKAAQYLKNQKTLDNLLTYGIDQIKTKRDEEKQYKQKILNVNIDSEIEQYQKLIDDWVAKYKADPKNVGKSYLNDLTYILKIKPAQTQLLKYKNYKYNKGMAEIAGYNYNVDKPVTLDGISIPYYTIEETTSIPANKQGGTLQKRNSLLKKKFLAGGKFVNYYSSVDFELARQKETPQKISEKSEEEKEEKGKLTEKDLFNMVKDVNGLPNEMKGIIDNLTETFMEARTLSSDGDLGNLQYTYLQSLYKIKLAAQNKVKYDEAVKSAKESGALAEPAISMNGNLFIQTPGGVKEITVEQYNANKDTLKNYVLSVSQFANLRAYNPNFSYQQLPFDIINNSVGFESFLKILKEGIATLGKSENKQNGVYGLDKSSANAAIQALQYMPADTKLQVIDGIITGTIEMSDQNKQIQQLTAYLVALFPDRLKTWASFKTGISDKDVALKNLVLTYLASTSSDSFSRTYDYDAYIKRMLTTAKETKEKEDSIQQNISSKWLAGYGDQEMFSFKTGASSTVIARANTMPLTGQNGSYLGSSANLQQATEGDFTGVLDWSQASIAGSVISPMMFNQVILTDGKIRSIDYPSTMDAHGKIIPAITKEIVQAKKEADLELLKMGINIGDPTSIAKNYNTINEVYAKYKLDPRYDADGNPTNWTRFGVTNIATDGRTFSEEYNETLLDEITNDYEAEQLESIIKGYNKDYSYAPTSWTNWNGDKLYKGTVWIPVKNSHAAAMGKQLLKSDQALKLDEREQAARMYNKPSYIN